MQELWSSASYEPHLLSLLFAFAPVAMLVVIAYAAFMRGEPVLRAWLLMHFVTLMPLFVSIALAPSIVSPNAAAALFRIAAACIPSIASAQARFEVTVDLPTPPLPEPTQITFLTAARAPVGSPSRRPRRPAAAPPAAPPDRPSP